MHCPNCQHENRAAAKFGQECGTKLHLLRPQCGGEAGYEWRSRNAERLSPILGKGTWRTPAGCGAQARRHGRRWDETQQSPWYVFSEGDAFVQGSYNDWRAWQVKLDWIRRQGLGGVGVWVLRRERSARGLAGPEPLSRRGTNGRQGTGPLTGDIGHLAGEQSRGAPLRQRPWRAARALGPAPRDPP